jgi:hypothetical protein
MTQAKTLLTMQRWVWICIYSGLMGIALSLFIDKSETTLTRIIQCAGGLLVALGIALIYIRSQLTTDTTP